MRLIRISGADLRLFEFDYDLTFAVFLMNADETIYGRFGGRDAKSADDRQSLAGLRHAMQAALATHRAGGKGIAPPREGKPLYVDDYPTAKQKYRGGCIHCHQVAEIQREEAVKAGNWNRETVWGWPLPENVGITLDVDRGNEVKEVIAGSPANKAGLKAGDKLQSLNGLSVNSFGDAQYALFKAPVKGEIAITWLHGEETRSGKLTVAEGWKKTNPTWRPSLLDILPSLTLFGTDLTPEQKRSLGLGEKRLAFRQDPPVHSEARAVGVQEGDVIIGLNNEVMETTVSGFLAHVRRNYLVGDRITLNVMRNGKQVNLPMKLK